MSEEKVKKNEHGIEDLIDLRSKVLDDIEKSRKLLSEIEAAISLSLPASGANTFRRESSSQTFNHGTVRTGIQRLDDLLGGGFPDASNIMLSGPPYSSKYRVANHFILSSLNSGYPVIVVSLDRDVQSLRDDLSMLEGPIGAYEEKGLLKFVDAYSRNIQMENTNKNTLVIEGASNTSLFLKTLDNICNSFVTKFGRYRMVLFSLTGWITQSGDEKNFPKALQHFSQRRKLEGSTTLYLIEDGIFDRSLYENMNYFMDGSIEFRSESSTEYLRVRGMRKIKSRDWIELIDDGGLVSLGSFELRRIK